MDSELPPGRLVLGGPLLAPPPSVPPEHLSGIHSSPVAPDTISHVGVFIFGGAFHLIITQMQERQLNYFLSGGIFHVPHSLTSTVGQ